MSPGYLIAPKMYFGIVPLFMFWHVATSITSDHMRDLQEHLFANYSASLRPSKNYSQPTIVKLKVSITDLMELNEVQRYLTVFCIFLLTWKDDFLKWDPGLYGGIKKVEITSLNIWKPYLKLFSCYDDMDVFRDGRYGLTVYNDGSVKWKPSMKISVVCDINVVKFPFDTQACDLKFSPLHYPNEEVQLAVVNISEVNDNSLMRQGGWEIAQPTYYSNVRPHEGEQVSVMKVSLELKRQHTSFLLNYGLPIFLLSFLNLLTFCLPNDSGEKVSFSTTVLLSLTMFLTTISSNLPKDGKSLVYITVYIANLLVLSCCTVSTTIVLLFFHHKKKIKDEMLRNQVIDLTKEESKYKKVMKQASRVWKIILCKSDYDSKSGCTIDVFLFLVFFLWWTGINAAYFILAVSSLLT